MKTGLATSVALHVGVIAFAVLSLSAPRPFDVADVETLPVDLVPVQSITKTQQGDKKAGKTEKPAPVPTERPDHVAEASKVGDNEVDLDTPPTPEPKPKPVETAAAQPPSKEPEPKPVERPKPEPVKKPEPKPVEKPQPKAAEEKPKPEPVPATQKSPEPKPKQEVKPDPVKEAIVAESEKPDAVALPDTAPVPTARPRPPQAQTAKAPDHEDTEQKPATKTASTPKSETKDQVLDDVAALLNKEKPSGGGAKRSTQTASLGAKKTTGDTLSQSELDALRGQIEGCWNVPAGALDAENLKVSIKFKLNQSGGVEGSPQIIDGGGGSTMARAAAESARRAILQCGPYNLPADKYETWAEVIVNFDPSDMF